MNILISPSGNWYGSEQVLYDYFRRTRLKFRLYINANGSLINRITRLQKDDKICSFDSVKLLYLRIFFLCLSGKVRSVYINEAGHSRYVFVLARLFPSKKFVIHVRLTEDTKADRWANARGLKNVAVIAISKYIGSLIPFRNTVVYDPYFFSRNNIVPSYEPGNTMKVGIIGRISWTKGLQTILDVLSMMDRSAMGSEYQIIFFGDFTEDVSINDRSKLQSYAFVQCMGFTEDKDSIYSSVDVVLHVPEFEGLGRIFFEAIDYGKPLIGIRRQGIGEIGERLGLVDLLIEEGEDMSEEIVKQLIVLRQDYNKCFQQVQNVRELAAEVFSPAKYTDIIDNLVSNN